MTIDHTITISTTDLPTFEAALAWAITNLDDNHLTTNPGLELTPYLNDDDQTRYDVTVYGTPTP